MSDLAPLRRYDLSMIRRAIDTSNRDGEAALNALLYAAAALLMSAVLLVITTPVLLAIPAAFIPWVVLAMFGWWWLAPALRDQMLVERSRSTRAIRARDAAADLLLDDHSSMEDRRAAAGYMLETLDPEERDRTTERLLGSGEAEPN